MHRAEPLRSLDEAARNRAFAALVDRPALDRAYRYATLVLGDRTEAEDATHDAALSAWRRFGDLRDASRFEAWFGRIVVNACRDRLRSRRRALVVLDSERLGVAADPADAVARRAAIGTALRTLSVDHREVVVLRFFADLTIEEIAARTGVGVGTVKSRLHYALRALRTTVGRDNELEDQTR